MKKILLYLISFIIVFSSCDRMIKNSGEQVENEIDSVKIATYKDTKSINNTNLVVTSKEDIFGFWVGYFHKSNNEDENKNIYGDEGLNWFRENKINISIDEIKGNKIKGHSVVAGNNRPFEGIFNEIDEKFIFEVSEPGDDQYDGKFNFTINKRDSFLEGTWKAFKKIDISERKYQLKKVVFKYNPNQMLKYSRRYGDWENIGNTKIDKEEGEIYKEFSSATELIYKLNASSELLSKTDLENLKKGDLLIIRNTIYARHGYSFKKRPIRIFFDAQPWYIPLHTDVKSEITEIEKKNIELLLKYEKNAKEYYDSFGRG